MFTGNIQNSILKLHTLCLITTRKTRFTIPTKNGCKSLIIDWPHKLCCSLVEHGNLVLQLSYTVLVDGTDYLVIWVDFARNIGLSCVDLLGSMWEEAKMRMLSTAGFLSHSDSGEESDWPCEVVSLTLDAMLLESWQVYSSERVNWLCLGWQWGFEPRISQSWAFALTTRL
jgi:hypothetical protein